MKPVPPLSDLLSGYLERQTEAHADGLGFADVEGDVVPHDAVPVQPVEPRLAWREALAVLPAFGLAVEKSLPTAPAEWPALVAAHEPETALPFALGNFPQLVRHLPALLHAVEPAAPRASAGPPLGSSSLEEWARKESQKGQPLSILLAAGVLRLARRFDLAEELLRQGRTRASGPWQAVWANEEAALAWQRGRLEQAAALWQAQDESVPVLFNRGLAHLFLGRPGPAGDDLRRAAAALAEEDAWHHLARLYGTLTTLRA